MEVHPVAQAEEKADKRSRPATAHKAEAEPRAPAAYEEWLASVLTYVRSAWGNKAPQKIPLCFMRALARLNFMVFRWTGQAPVDHFLRPDSFNFMAGRTWWFSVEKARRAFTYTPTPLCTAIDSMKEMKEEIEVDTESWYNQ